MPVVQQIRAYVFGTVPTVPNALRGINEPDAIEFCGGFDKVAVVLSYLGNEYKDSRMIKAADIFESAASDVSQIKEIIVDYLSERRDNTEQLPGIFTQVAIVMKSGMEAL